MFRRLGINDEEISASSEHAKGFLVPVMLIEVSNKDSF